MKTSRLTTPASCRLLLTSLLFGSVSASAADPFVRILGIGQGYVVPPGESFKIEYQVSPSDEVDHYFYLDDSLALIRNASLISRTSSGHFSVTYPAGLAEGRILGLRICAATALDPICDAVSIRAGKVLSLGQELEIAPIAAANYVPPLEAIAIGYSILRPTVADQLFYVDGELRAQRSSSSSLVGPQSITYPGGLAEGQSIAVQFCIAGEGASLGACGYADITAGVAPDGVDVPAAFSAADLDDHLVAISGCTPVCGYYSNIYYGDSAVSWLPERGDGLVDALRADLYYATPDGRIDYAAAPATLIIYAHSAGSNKESLLTRNQSILRNLFAVADSAAGVIVAAVDFRHPLKQLNNELRPASIKDLSHAVQFFRYYASDFNIDPDDIFLVGTSLGAGAVVHAAVREIANPEDAAPVRRVSSAVRGAIVRDAQTSFSPHWFGRHFLEAPVAARYQSNLLTDERRQIYGHAPAEVSGSSPYLELTYTSRFIDHRVTLDEYQSRMVDLVHLPNYGLAMEEQYRLHGIDERIRVLERYAGNFGQDAAQFVRRHRLKRD